MIEVVHDRSASEFVSKARELLYSDEAVNSLAIGICDELQMSISRKQPLLLRLLENKKTVGTAIHADPMGLLLTKAPAQAIENLVRHLCVTETSLRGVAGPAEEAALFCDLWLALNGKSVLSVFDQAVLRIEKVCLSKKVEGEFRLARNEDVALLAEWTRVFAGETFGDHQDRRPSYWRTFVEKDILARKTFLWVKKGVPVSMACLRRTTRNGSSISSVYTPEDQRGQGFASALVANLSQRVLDHGKKFCVLYADRSNERACRMYTDIGYEEVARSKHYQFQTVSVA